MNNVHKVWPYLQKYVGCLFVARCRNHKINQRKNIEMSLISEKALECLECCLFALFSMRQHSSDSNFRRPVYDKVSTYCKVLAEVQ